MQRIIERFSPLGKYQKNFVDRRKQCWLNTTRHDCSINLVIRSYTWPLNSTRQHSSSAFPSILTGYVANRHIRRNYWNSLSSCWAKAKGKFILKILNLPILSFFPVGTYLFLRVFLIFIAKGFYPLSVRRLNLDVHILYLLTAFSVKYRNFFFFNLLIRRKNIRFVSF